MTFYEVEYTDEGAPGGYARLFFTSKRAAVKAKREIEQSYLDAKRAWQAAHDSGVDYYEMPADPGQAPHPRIDTIRLTGTCQEKILRAFRYAR